MDDDIALTDSDSIREMKKVLDSSDDIGLCAGMIHQENGDYFGGEIYSRGLKLQVENGILYRHKASKKISRTNGTLFNYADQVVNFFLAKQEIFKDVSWDNRIKVEYDHMDFFLGLKKTRWKATVCLGAKVLHLRQPVDSFYNRHRRSAPMQYFYGKHGIQNVINRYLQQGGRR